MEEVVTYLVHCIDKYLSIFPSKTINNTSRAPVREDCLDKGHEFTLRDGAANQAMQGSFTGIENEGWLRGG